MTTITDRRMTHGRAISVHAMTIKSPGTCSQGQASMQYVSHFMLDLPTALVCSVHDDHYFTCSKFNYHPTNKYYIRIKSLPVPRVFEACSGSHQINYYTYRKLLAIGLVMEKALGAWYVHIHVITRSITVYMTL